MINYGDIKSGEDIYCFFHTADADGARANWDSMPAVAVYKNNDTTEVDTASPAITLTETFDSKNGLHLIHIDTSQGSFFTTGNSYTIVVEGTIDSTNVRAVVGFFSIERDYPYQNITAPTGDPANWTDGEKLLWLVYRFMNKHSSDNVNGVRVYNDNDELLTEQPVSEIGGVRTVNGVTEP